MAIHRTGAQATSTPPIRTIHEVSGYPRVAKPHEGEQSMPDQAVRMADVRHALQHGRCIYAVKAARVKCCCGSAFFQHLLYFVHISSDFFSVRFSAL
jgi:hypothetical protein